MFFTWIDTPMHTIAYFHADRLKGLLGNHHDYQFFQYRSYYLLVKKIYPYFSTHLSSLKNNKQSTSFTIIHIFMQLTCTKYFHVFVVICFYKKFCIMFTLHRYVLKYKQTTHFTAVFEKFIIVMSWYLTFARAKVKVKLSLHFFFLIPIAVFKALKWIFLDCCNHLL